MGYYTEFELEVVIGRKELTSLFVQNCKAARDALNIDGRCTTAARWYAHEEDLRDFSSQHEGVLFKLSGEGEDPGDLWVKYFLSGKMQACYAEIVYPEFDDSLMD